MLNRDERRQLAAIERHLRREDPGLARRLTRGRGGPRWWCTRWAVPTLVVLAALCVLLGLMVSEATVLLGGLILLGLALRLLRSRPRTEDDRRQRREMLTLHGRGASPADGRDSPHL